MSVANYIPQVWVAPLMAALRKTLVYAGPQIVNRDYEGEINEAGDTVKVTSIGRPSVGTYVPNVTKITPEKLNTSQRTMTIDQAKYFAFEVDDVDKRQVKGDLIVPSMSEAAFALADIVDQYVASMYTSIPAGNLLPAITSFGTTDEEMGKKAYRVLVDLKTRMGELSIPKEGRYVVVPEWFHSLILLNPNFINAEKYGSSGNTPLLNGEVGRAAGFNILVSNNNPSPSAGQNVLQAGVNRAISFAEQINKTEAYRPQDSFSDAVKGLALYGAKVMRPDHLAGVTVTRPA